MQVMELSMSCGIPRLGNFEQPRNSLNLGSCEERSVPQTDNEIESFKEKPGVNEGFFCFFCWKFIYVYSTPLVE